MKLHKFYNRIDASTLKRKYADADEEDSYTHLRKQIQVIGIRQEQNQVEDLPVTTVTKGNLLNHQVPTSISESFKFKLVAGPTQSGKTQWTMKFLKGRRQQIDPPLDGIFFCYSEWQDSVLYNVKYRLLNSIKEYPPWTR